ncbi:MAG: hypothetical protein ABFD16_02515 [Thermoguttaceae bacterium]|jgi:hypothetical protein
MPTRQEVAEFLAEFKAAVSLGYVHWLPRPADRQHLIDLGITQNQALECIQHLTPDNYCKGPEPDDTKPDRCVWVFGDDIGGVEAYIKLALQPDKRKRHVTHAMIWSFHKADYPLKYPLRGNRI